MMYMGTTVATGRAVGVVVDTGMKTQLGRIASDISEAQTPKTPLEQNLNPWTIPRIYCTNCSSSPRFN